MPQKGKYNALKSLKVHQENCFQGLYACRVAQNIWGKQRWN